MGRSAEYGVLRTPGGQVMVLVEKPGRLAVLVTSLAALLLQLATLSRPSLWMDEAATISAVRRPLPDLFRLVQHHDLALLPYYLGMHWWCSVFGTSAFAVRLPSALVGAALVGVTARIAVVLAGPAAGWVAGALATVLPGVSWMGLDARPYAFAALAVAVAFLLSLRSDRVVATVLWVGAAAVIQLMSVLQLVMLPWSPRRWTKRRVALLATVLVAIGAFGVACQRQSAQIAWAAKESVLDNLIAALFTQFVSGARSTTVLSGVADWANIALAAALAASAVLVAVRRGRARLLRWAYVPGVLAALAGGVGVHVYVFRYFAPSVAALAVVAGVVLAGLTRQRRIALLALLIALCLPAFVAQRVSDGKWGENPRRLAAVINEAPAGLPVVYAEPSAQLIGVAYPDQLAHRPQFPAVSAGWPLGQLWVGASPTRQWQVAHRSGGAVLVSVRHKRPRDTAALRSHGCRVSHVSHDARLAVTVLTCP